MRWLLIGLLVSLGTLLLAAAAVACHIRSQREKLRARQVVNTGSTLDTPDEADGESEI
jgi:hypothetical protein